MEAGGERVDIPAELGPAPAYALRDEDGRFPFAEGGGGRLEHVRDGAAPELRRRQSGHMGASVAGMQTSIVLGHIFSPSPGPRYAAFMQL